MRAVVVDRLMTPEELSVREIDPPSLGEGELRIEVRAAGCNFSDVLMLKGEYQVKPPLPFVPGGEVGGLVKEVGPGVTGFAVGDRVLSRCALGGFAEEVAAPAAQTYALPDALSFEAGAALPRETATPRIRTTSSRLGQSDALTDRRGIDARLGLHQVENLAIDMVQGNWLHNICSFFVESA